MKWGILATGNIAGKFAGTIKAMADEGEVLSAVGSRSLEKAEAFAEAHGIPSAYGSYEALAADPEVEAVYVATPNNMHYENVRMCLEAGKHVLCEKPFTTSAREARELYALAAKKGLFVMEGLWILFLPAYRKLRELVRGGAVGTVRYARAEYGFVAKGARRERKFRAELGGGALLDVGIYTLAFLRAVMGEEYRKITTDLHLNEWGTDDFSSVQLEYAGSAVGHAVQAIGLPMGRAAVVYGTDGIIEIPDFQQCDRFTVKPYEGEEKTYSFPILKGGFEYEIREFTRLAGTGKSSSGVYGEKEGVQMMELLEKARLAGKMLFPWEEKETV